MLVHGPNASRCPNFMHANYTTAADKIRASVSKLSWYEGNADSSCYSTWSKRAVLTAGADWLAPANADTPEGRWARSTTKSTTFKLCTHQIRLTLSLPKSLHSWCKPPIPFYKRRFSSQNGLSSVGMKGQSILAGNLWNCLKESVSELEILIRKMLLLMGRGELWEVKQDVTWCHTDSPETFNHRCHMTTYIDSPETHNHRFQIMSHGPERVNQGFSQRAGQVIKKKILFVFSH